MNDKELLAALRQVGPEDRHRCLGCGYEHHCTTHGCAVTRAAAERIEALRTELDALRTRREPDLPLTLEELREMDDQPVWLVGVSRYNKSKGRWDICNWLDGILGTFPNCMESPRIEDYGITWWAYRRKPGEGEAP